MKYSGTAGFAIDNVEVSPGVYQNQIITRRIKGDVLDNRYSYPTNQNSTIDNVRLSNRLSILLDPFLRTHIGELIWVSFSGSKWNVESVNPMPPRVIISLGGVYNE